MNLSLKIFVNPGPGVRNKSFLHIAISYKNKYDSKNKNLCE